MSAASTRLLTTTSHCVLLTNGLITFVNGPNIGVPDPRVDAASIDVPPPSKVGVQGEGSASNSKIVLEVEVDMDMAVLSEGNVAEVGVGEPNTVDVGEALPTSVCEGEMGVTGSVDL
jgi:hypothetical protein